MRTAFQTLIAAVLVAAPAASADFPVYIDGTSRIQAVTGAADQSAPAGERSVFYQIAYPRDWESMGLAAPICNPCDHAQDGVQWTDYHDHLMTRPDLEHRHVFNIEPAYTGDAVHDAEVALAYAERLPVMSAVDANRLMAARLPTGEPIAQIVDYDFYFDAKLKALN